MIRRTSLAITALLVFGAPAALADDSSSSSSTPPVTEPTVQSQSGPEAQSEAAASKVAPPADINSIKARGAAEIAKRQKSLGEAASKLSAQKTDCGFNAAMTNEIKNTATSLTTLGVNLASTTDPVQAKAFLKSIYIDHRVYALVLPKAGKVIRCDVILARTAALTSDATALQTKLDAAKASGVNTAAAQASKDAGMLLLPSVNPAPAVAPVMGLVPDRGVDVVQASNAAALKTSDLALDAQYAIQKQVHQQFNDARKALAPAVKEDREDDRKAEKDAKKAEREAERDRREAERKAKKAERETEREAKKAAKKSEKESKKDDKDDKD